MTKTKTKNNPQTVSPEIKLAVAKSYLTKPFIDKDLGLTEGEREAAKFAAYGFTNPEIAQKMGITDTAAVDYLKRAKKKLGVNKAGLTKMLLSKLAETLDISDLM